MLHGDRAGYSHLQTCGSVHACPCCSGKILAERTDEIERLVEAVHAAGGAVALFTGTIRHARRDALQAGLDGVLGAWAAVRRGGSVRRTLDRLDYDGFVRRFEVTDGANGWHPHVHALLVFRRQPTEDDRAKLEEAMWRSWSASIRRAGLPEPTREHGVDLKLLDLSQAREAAAGYLTKGHPAESASAAAREVTGAGKRGRRGNRTHWQILGDLVTHGDAQDLARWREYETVTEGRRLVTWTPGLRDRYAIRDERDDETIAAEPDEQAIPVCDLTRDDWHGLRELDGRPADLLHSVGVYRQAGWDLDELTEEVDRMLVRWGVRAARGHERGGVTRSDVTDPRDGPPDGRHASPHPSGTR